MPSARTEHPADARLPVHMVGGPADRAAVTNTAECGDLDRGAAARLIGDPGRGIGVDDVAFFTHQAGTRFTADVRDPDGTPRNAVAALLACARVIRQQYGYRSATINAFGLEHDVEVGDHRVTLRADALCEHDGPVLVHRTPLYHLRHSRTDSFAVAEPLGGPPGWLVDRLYEAAGRRADLAVATVGPPRELHVRSYRAGRETAHLSNANPVLAMAVRCHRLSLLGPGPVTVRTPSGNGCQVTVGDGGAELTAEVRVLVSGQAFP